MVAIALANLASRAREPPSSELFIGLEDAGIDVLDDDPDEGTPTAAVTSATPTPVTPKPLTPVSPAAVEKMDDPVRMYLTPMEALSEALLTLPTIHNGYSRQMAR